MDLKSFAKSKNVDIGNVSDDALKSLENQAKQYQGKSESELMQELARQIEHGKKDGSFTPEAVDKFMKQVSPMLNSQQLKKMQQMLGRFK